MRNRHWLIFALIAGIAAAAPLAAKTGALDGLFSGHAGESFDLKGLRVWMGRPVRVTSQLAWQTVVWPFGPKDVKGTFYSVIPTMAKFPGGNLIAMYTLDPDSFEDPVSISGFQISRDGGQHWGRRYSVLMHHNPMTFIPIKDDSLLGVASELHQRVPGDDRNFVGPLWIFQKGGEQMLMVPEGMRVVDWPWPVGILPSPQPRESWQVNFRFISGGYVKKDGRLLIVGEIQKKSDDYEKLGWNLYSVVLASDDEGRTWRYLSTLGEPHPALRSQGKEYEGADEPAIVSLADGSLMGVFRVGTNTSWHLRRRYSEDAGRTWSKEDILPAWSVSPHLSRISNGTIALTTGRPGLFLWLATDPRATDWQSVDILGHHNRFVADAHDRILPRRHNEKQDFQTSSYTGLVDMGNNHLLIAYDRCPEEAPAGPDDRSSVYVVPVTVERR